MNIKHILIGLCYLFLQISSASSQGTLLFLNGKEKRFSTAEVKGEYILYKPEGKQGNWFKRADRYNVFAIIRDDSGEELVYQPDTTDEGDPPIAEVREYIKGEQYAAEVYKKPMNFIGGFLTGAAGSFAGFYGFPAPIVYATIVGQFNPKLPKNERENNYSDAFISGYEKKSRNIKIKNSLIGGTIGFGVGVTAFIIIFSQD